jgi:hypothetical protein
MASGACSRSVERQAEHERMVELRTRLGVPLRHPYLNYLQSDFGTFRREGERHAEPSSCDLLWQCECDDPFAREAC